MKKIIHILPALVIVTYFLVSPEVASAQGLVPCEGTDCSFCHIISLGQNVLNWIFGIVFVIFGVVAVAAGCGLVTSGGNQSKLDDAKKKLSNAVIGLIIVFSAWLIVDTLLKAVIPDDGSLSGVSGELGMWNSIDCDVASQPEPAAAGRWEPPERADDDGGEGVNATAWVATGDIRNICTRTNQRNRCVERTPVPIEERTVTEVREVCTGRNAQERCEDVEVERVERRYSCVAEESRVECPEDGYRSI